MICFSDLLFHGIVAPDFKDDGSRGEYMRKEIRKTYVYAVMKIVFSILGYALVLYVLNEANEANELDLAGNIVCGVIWGIAALIYFFSGFFTLKNGDKRLNEYMEASGYTYNELEYEYETAEDFGRTHVGNVHVFANASNGFHVIPLDSIEKIWVGYHGANRLKGRKGHYYLHIKYVGTEEEYIRIYYVVKGHVKAAEQCILEKIDAQKGVCG